MPLGAGDTQGVLDLPASIRQHLVRQGIAPLPLKLQPEDLRKKLFLQQKKALIVFVVDASESMGEGNVERIKAAKGAILGLLATAYQKRDQVAMVVFRDRRAQVLLQPTSSIVLARQSLRQLPVGGATPFADGLQQARQLVENARRKQPDLQPTLVIVSDGEANVPLVAGAEVLPELYRLAGQLRRERVQAIIVDSGATSAGRRNLKRLAAELGGSYRPLRDLHAGHLFAVIRQVGIRGGRE